MGAEVLEEGDIIFSIGGRHLIATDSRLVGIFPAKEGKSERRSEGLGNALDLLKVDSIKTVFADDIEDSLYKHGTVLRSDRRREETGTSPPADGDASQRIMVMSQLDELRNEGGSRAIKTEDGGVLGRDAKMWVRALSLENQRSEGVRKRTQRTRR